MEYANLSNRKLLDLYYSKSQSLRGIINAYIDNDKADRAPDTTELKAKIKNIQDELERRARKEGLSNIEFDEKYRWMEE